MLGSVVAHVLHFDIWYVCLSTPISKIRSEFFLIRDCKVDEKILN